MAAWFGLRFARGGLRTVEGDEVRVDSPGIRQSGAGPDFAGARVRIGAREEVGEVELHCDTADWARHGHDRDPRYERVVLHVSLEATTEVVTASGRRVPRLVVAPAGPEPQARRRVSVVAAEAGIGPCHGAPAARLVREVEAQGLARFEERAAEFAAMAADDGIEEAVWGALAEAMGFGANEEAFRALALYVPWRTFDGVPAGAGRAGAVEASLLRASGLWPADPRDAAARARLATLFPSLPPDPREPFRPSAWRLSVRPPDSPVRRFAALASLVAESTPAALLDRWAADPPSTPRSLLVPSLPFWDRRSAWGPPRFRRPVALLGPDRARVAAASSLLPLVAALRPAAAPAARASFQSLGPLPEDHVTRFVRFRVFGAPSGRRLSAAAHQGLHHLYRAGCGLGKPGCLRCPLAPDIARL